MSSSVGSACSHIRLLTVPAAGNAVSAAMVTHWVCNVAIGQNFMAAVGQYGISAVYGFFGICSLIAAGYVSGNVPETKGKTFDQIQSEMDRK